MKILILKPSSLGDVIHALPVLRMLKRHNPSHEIYWWIRADFAPLLENDPDLDGLFLFERKGWRQSGWLRRTMADVRAMREKQFDVVLDLQGLSRSAIFAWLAGGETVVGLATSREGASMAYDVTAPRTPPGTLATDRYLTTLSVLGVPVDWNIEWLPVRTAAAAQVRDQAKLHPGRWVMLLPGARWDNKRWPVESFAQTVRSLAAKDPQLNFAILGAKSDQSLAEAIVRAEPKRCVDLTGRTSMSEMIEWLRLADVVVSNDTGPLHVAAALNRPLVAIYGPTDPRRTGPYGHLDQVLQTRALPCVPCLKDTCSYRDPLACLHAITPEQVSAKVLTLLSR